MTRFFWAIFAAIIVLLMIANASEAQGANCAPRDIALSQLAKKWGETRRSVMLANGRVFEVYASDETGTWTILRTTPDGLSCITASGIAYEQVSVTSGDPA